MGTGVTLLDASPLIARRLGAERSLVQIQSPRLDEPASRAALKAESAPRALRGQRSRPRDSVSTLTLTARTRRFLDTYRLGLEAFHAPSIADLFVYPSHVTSDAGGEVYEFETSCSLADAAGEVRIAALAHNELS